MRAGSRHCRHDPGPTPRIAGRSQWAMPARLLMVGPGELEAELVSRGLQVSADPGSRTLLRRALSEVRSGRRVITVDRPGWHLPTSGTASYVMQDGTVIGDAAEQVVLRS